MSGRCRALWMMLLVAAMVGSTASGASLDGEEGLVGDPSSSFVYTPIAPCRIVDTRRPGSPGKVGILPIGVPREWAAEGVFDFRFQGGDPSCPGLKEAGAKAYALTVAAVGFSKQGGLRLHAASTPPPTGATITFAKGQLPAVANGLIVRGCDTCADQLEVIANGAATHVTIDVHGYFTQAQLPEAPEPPEVPALTNVANSISGQCGSVQIAPNGSGTAMSDACPAGYVIVGGQCNGDSLMRIFDSLLINERWSCSARDMSGITGARPLYACAVCMRAPVRFE